jgi:phospholipid/cholesterol/gamma-HCH transport system substrate-binding protein
MAQRKQLTWAELRVGLFVLAGLFIMAVAIFYVTGAGILGPKYRVITYLPEVESLTTGAPVRLDGLEVGNVQTMRLTPNPSDRMHNIELVLRIDKKFEDSIRTDSYASLATEGLLGNRYVTISRGLTGSVIPNNGTIPGKEEAEMKALVEKGSALMENLGTLSQDLRGIVDKVQNGQGSIGLFMNDPAFYNHLNSTVARLDAVAGSIQKGEGTLGKLTASDELYNKVDDVVSAVQQQKGAIGKLVYDPAMYDSAKSFMDKGNGVLDDVRAGKGTIGKALYDQTLYNNLRDASANVRDATAKLNANEGTAGKLFNDPKLYDNMTALTSDLRLMVNDFRQNPKKFLHVKLAVF